MYKKISLIFAVSVLTGCAGMNSDFEHAIPAKDSGYWLQQADDMTNPNAGGSLGMNKTGLGGGRVDVKQYRLINTSSIRLPVKVVGTVQPNANDNVKDEFEPVSISYHPTNSSSECTLKYCYPEPNRPFRRDDSVSRVWLAPYVSPDDNAHLGEIVYFVTKKSQWANVEQKSRWKIMGFNPLDVVNVISNLFGEKDTSNETSQLMTELEFAHIRDLIPFKYYDQDSGLFINDQSIGFIIETQPLIGANEQLVESFNRILQSNIPRDHYLQVSLLGSKAIKEIVNLV